MDGSLVHQSKKHEDVCSLRERSQKVIQKGKRLRAEAQRLIEESSQRCAHVAWLVEITKSQWGKDARRPLQAAIQALHRCGSEHLASFAVRKVSDGQTVWEGMVEEFRLLGHVEAERCYAWHYFEYDKRQSFSLLKLPPVDSPQRAVQLALATRKFAQKRWGASPNPSASGSAAQTNQCQGKPAAVRSGRGKPHNKNGRARPT